MQAPGRKVAILGLGKTGYESACFLHSRSFDVFVSESGASSLSPALEKKKIPFEIGGHTLKRLLESDWVLVSPGIPPNAFIVKELQEEGVPIYSEIEVASWFSPTKRIVAVTGTSGKTTVTTLLGNVLSAQYGAGHVKVCGNIGNPWIGEIETLTVDSFVVLELSSFQLAFTQSLKPHIAILLNISPNHLDWHRDMEDYISSKLKLFKAQDKKDFALISNRDQKTYFPNQVFSSKIVDFEAQGGQGSLNEKAVRAAAKLCGCRDEQIKKTLTNFQGIEHRLERLGSAKGVAFINDSKCTTTASLAWALDQFEASQVVLIAGGRAKASDFSEIADQMAEKVKKAFVIGEAQTVLREAWQGACSVEVAHDLESAFQKAIKVASDGDVVLLSPACASFDQFTNYEARGETFKKLWKKWAQLEVPKTHV